MLRVALCLCILAQLGHGQIDGYETVPFFSCDDNRKNNPELIIKTEATGSIKSPCYDNNTYTSELDAGLRLVNISHASPFLYGYQLVLEDFQIAESDRLYVGSDFTDSGRNSEAFRNITLTSNSTSDGKVYIQYVEDGPIDGVLTLNTSNNAIFLEGYSQVFLDFYTVVNTLAGRGFLIKYNADINKCLFTGDGVYCKNSGVCSRTGVNLAECNCTIFWGGPTCEIDIDECAINTHECAMTGNCTDVDGGYNCLCNDGYIGGVGGPCIDINECTENTHRCALTGNCTNVLGGYNCTCNDGYIGGVGGPCTDVNECATGDDNCNASATCTNIEPSFTCACNSGYAGDGVDCVDINECTENTHECAMTGNCTNAIGEYNCVCNAGYTGGAGGPCTDIDQCAVGLNDCDDSARATCTDGLGIFTCACRSGYTGDGTNCTDIDECMPDGGNNCATERGNCTNTEGSFSCSCVSGYTGDGVSCIDFDECANDIDNDCHARANCTNTVGDYTCQCKKGFSGTGLNCADNDECVDDSDNDCHTNANCANFAGGFNCTCKDGFSGNGKDCSNINECTSPSPCHSDADCRDTDGDFVCTCKPGYTGDGAACTDIEECDLEMDNCHSNASCTNIASSFTCKCFDGFSGTGQECSDIKECESSSLNDCDTNAACLDFNGNYTCTCNAGWKGDGRTCEDKDECALSSDNNCTGIESTCNNVPSTYECICNKPVYRGPLNNCVYYCENDSDCRTDIEGFIDMPVYSDGVIEYAVFDETYWNFTGTANGLRLTFRAFDTEVKDDILSIYPGNSEDTATEIVAISGKIGKLYNNKNVISTSGYIERSGSVVTALLDISTSEPVLTLSSSNLLFVFKSDRLNVSTGFILEWQYDTEDCPSTNPCFNGGSCEDRAFDYQCVGCSGYEGRNCDIDIDECAPDRTSKCDVNANCVNTEGDHNCTCKDDYIGTGETCDQHIVIDNLNIIKTTSSLSVGFDVTSAWSSELYILTYTISLSRVESGVVVFDRSFSVNTTELAANPFEFSGLGTNTEYTLNITILVTGANFGSSVVTNRFESTVVSTEETVPGVPKSAALSNSQRDRITFTWEKPVEIGFGTVLYYQVCYSPSENAAAVADLRGIDVADVCLILDDTYTSITLTNLYSYLELDFKIRAFSSKGYGNFTSVETAFTGTECVEWNLLTSARTPCNGEQELVLVSNGFPRAQTTGDNNVIEQYWSFDHSSVTSWRINIFYFNIQQTESTLDYGYGDLDITDHDIERNNFVMAYTGVIAAASQSTVTRNMTDTNTEIAWFAFLSDRTRKQPGFQVEVESDRDSCIPNPCLNGGTCTDGSFSYTCDCTATDWTGDDCEQPHIKPTLTCTPGKRDAAIIFNVQEQWRNDETVIGGYTITQTGGGSAISRDLGDTTASFTGLNPFTSYTFNATVTDPGLRRNAVRAMGSILCTTLEDKPTVPLNVAVLSKIKSLDVSWDPPAQPNGVVTYIVTYETTGARISSSSLSTTSYTVTGLQDYTNYSIIVTAATSAGSTPADAVVETTSAGAPFAFDTEKVTVLPSNTARVEWTFVDDKYIGPVTVTVSAKSDIHEPAAQTSDPDAASMVFTGLEENQIYTFTLTASTGTDPDTTTTVTDVNTNSTAPGVTATFEYDVSTSTFSWTEPSPLDQNGVITGYIITAVPAISTIFTNQTFGVSELSFQLNDLPPFTEYTFEIQALNSDGVGLERTLLITTKEEIAKTPTSLATGTVGPQNITVTWEVETPLVGQTIYIITYTVGTTSMSFESALTSTTISGLAPFTSYTITVVARTNAGDSPATADFNVRTAEDKPTEVQNLVANFILASYEISVSWDGPAIANGVLGDYSITWTAGTTSGSGTSSTTSFTISNVILSSTDYVITVWSSTGAGDGPTSSFTISTPELLPEVPADVSVDQLGNTSVRVTIDTTTTTPITPTNYIIILSQDTADCIAYSDMNCLSNDRTNQPQTSELPYTITGLKSYRKYVLWVAAKSPGGESTATNNITFQTLAGVPDSVINIVSVTQPGGVVVTFDAGTPFTGPSSYEVTLSTTDGLPITQTITETSQLTNISTTITGVSGYTVYTVTVIATSVAGSSSPSSPSTSVTTRPNSPSYVVTRDSSVQFTINNITAVEGATSYGFSYVQANCDNCTIVSNSTTDQNFIISGLIPYTDYNISVYAISSAGASSVSTFSEKTRAGTPQLMDSDYKLTPVETTDSFRAAYTVVLVNPCTNKENIFDESQGPIMSVRYIVIQDGTPATFEEVRYYGQVHANQPSEPYQALTISCSSNQRKKREVTADRHVAIGANSSCPAGGTTECNGLLKPDTEYTFRGCGINEEGNEVCTVESDKMKTDPAPPSRGLSDGEIAAIVICSILLLILIILLIVFIVKRRRSRQGKHRVSRKGTDNPALASSTGEQQKYKVDPAAEPQTAYTDPPVDA